MSAGFAVNETALNHPAFISLSDRAARLLLRAAHYTAAHGLDVVYAAALRAMHARPAEAEELARAGFWDREGEGWIGAIDLRTPPVESARVRAGRLGGQRSAQRRAEQYGTAQPRPSPPEANAEASPKQTPKQSFEANAEPSFEARDPSLPPPGPPSQNKPSSLPSSSAFPALLALSEDLKASAGARTKAEKRGWKRVPAEWQPSAAHIQIAADRRVDFDLELSKFRDHEFATAKRDADATFRNWLRSAKPAAYPVRAPVNGYRHATLAEIDQILGAT